MQKAGDIYYVMADESTGEVKETKSGNGGGFFLKLISVVLLLALGAAGGVYNAYAHNDLSNIFKQYQPQQPQVSGYMPNQFGGNLTMMG